MRVKFLWDDLNIRVRLVFHFRFLKDVNIGEVRGLLFIKD